MEIKIELGGRPAWLMFSGDYKPGDPCPEGYIDRQEWHKVQQKTGHRQRHCGLCHKWLYDFEECGHDKSKRKTMQQLAALGREVKRALQRDGLLPKPKRRKK